jgi:predicted transcriptional regulator
VNDSDNTVEVNMQLQLDNTSRAVLNIFASHPDRYWKCSQIRSILEYENCDVKYGRISILLDRFVIMGILSRDKRSRVYAYRMTEQGRKALKP